MDIFTGVATQLLKERICSSKCKFFPFRVDPMSKSYSIQRSKQVYMHENIALFWEKRQVHLLWILQYTVYIGGGQVVRWCWVNFQCRGVLLIWMREGQGPHSRCGWGLCGLFSLVYHFSFHSPSLWETAHYTLKYCLKGQLSPKQPTNQPTMYTECVLWHC